jgi:hypothetical protein
MKSKTLWRRQLRRTYPLIKLLISGSVDELMGGRFYLTTVRHNSVQMEKPNVFLGRRGTGCHFSNWRAVGVRREYA